MNHHFGYKCCAIALRSLRSYCYALKNSLWLWNAWAAVYDVRLCINITLEKLETLVESPSYKNVREPATTRSCPPLQQTTGMTFGDLSLVKHDNNKTHIECGNCCLFSHCILYLFGIPIVGKNNKVNSCFPMDKTGKTHKREINPQKIYEEENKGQVPNYLENLESELSK